MAQAVSKAMGSGGMLELTQAPNRPGSHACGNIGIVGWVAFFVQADVPYGGQWQQLGGFSMSYSWHRLVHAHFSQSAQVVLMSHIRRCRCRRRGMQLHRGHWLQAGFRFPLSPRRQEFTVTAGILTVVGPFVPQRHAASLDLES